MALSGFERISARPRGGVVRVELARAADFAGTTYDAVLERFTSFPPPEIFKEYVFREDRARYAEQIAREGAQPLVRHTLTMELPAGSDAHRRAANELSGRSGPGSVSISASGIVAIVTTAAGERLLVGWSRRFGAEYPLRVAGSIAALGATPADFPVLEITLASEDADPALALD